MLLKGKWHIMAIVLLALFLQLYGINFGLPYVYHPDEILHIDRALTRGADTVSFPGKLGSVGPGTPHEYMLLVIYGTYFVMGKMMGLFASPTDFIRLYLMDPSSFLLLGRLSSVTLGIMGILGLYLTGKWLYEKQVGILSALFLSSTLVFVQNAHYVTRDVPITAVTVFGLFAVVGMLRTGQRWYYLWAGLLAGLGAGLKINGAVLIFPLLVAYFLRKIWYERAVLKEVIVDRDLYLLGLCMVIGGVMGQPTILTNPVGTVQKYGSLYGLMRSGRVGGYQTMTSPWLYLVTDVLFASLGPILGILSLAGVVYALYRRRGEDVLLLSFIVPFFGIAGLSAVMYPRYLLPMIPALLLLAGRFLVDAVERCCVGERSRDIAVSAVAALIVVTPIYDILRWDRVISRKDTRSIAKEWIEQNIPSGTTIGVEGRPYSPALFPSRESLRKQLPRLLEQGRGRAVKILLDTSAERYPKVNYNLVSIWKEGEGYWLTGEPSRRAEEIFRDLYDAGAEYVVINSYDYSRYFSKDALQALASATEQRRRFYNLLGHYALMKEFVPQDGPGPIIKIYRLGGPGG